jgi:hypothetical protein
VTLQRFELQLVERVGRVRDQLAEEDLLVRVERVDDDVEELAGFGLECQGFSGGAHAHILRNDHRQPLPSRCPGVTWGAMRHPVMRRRLPLSLLAAAIAATGLVAQAPPTQPDWTSVEAEALGHYQALIRFDTVERSAARHQAGAR